MLYKIHDINSCNYICNLHILESHKNTSNFIKIYILHLFLYYYYVRSFPIQRHQGTNDNDSRSRSEQPILLDLESLSVSWCSWMDRKAREI